MVLTSSTEAKDKPTLLNSVSDSNPLKTNQKFFSFWAATITSLPTISPKMLLLCTSVASVTKELSMQMWSFLLQPTLKDQEPMVFICWFSEYLRSSSKSQQSCGTSRTLPWRLVNFKSSILIMRCGSPLQQRLTTPRKNLRVKSPLIQTQRCWSKRIRQNSQQIGHKIVIKNKQHPAGGHHR